MLSEVVTCNCFRNPGGHAESNPRPSEEGVSFYHVLRPLDQFVVPVVRRAASLPVGACPPVLRMHAYARVHVLWNVTTVFYRMTPCCCHGLCCPIPARPCSCPGPYVPLAHEVAAFGSCRSVPAWCVVCRVHPSAPEGVHVGTLSPACLVLRPCVVAPLADRV